MHPLRVHCASYIYVLSIKGDPVEFTLKTMGLIKYVGQAEEWLSCFDLGFPHWERKKPREKSYIPQKPVLRRFCSYKRRQVREDQEADKGRS